MEFDHEYAEAIAQTQCQPRVRLYRLKICEPYLRVEKSDSDNEKETSFDRSATVVTHPPSRVSNSATLYATNAFKRLERQVTKLTAASQCKDCKKMFTSPQIMEHHVQLKHNKFECAVCEKRYKTKTELSFHIAKQDINREPFVCKICKKKFHKEKNLKEHKRVHLDDKPRAAVCYICGECAINKKTLIAHIVLKHGFQAIKSFCKQENSKKTITYKKTSFTKAIDYEEAIKTVKLENLVSASYLLLDHCVVCGKKYLRKVCLTTHIEDKHCPTLLWDVGALTIPQDSSAEPISINIIVSYTTKKQKQLISTRDYEQMARQIELNVFENTTSYANDRTAKADANNNSNSRIRSIESTFTLCEQNPNRSSTFSRQSTVIDTYRSVSIRNSSSTYVKTYRASNGVGENDSNVFKKPQPPAPVVCCSIDLTADEEPMEIEENLQINPIETIVATQLRIDDGVMNFRDRKCEAILKELAVPRMLSPMPPDDDELATNENRIDEMPCERCPPLLISRTNDQVAAEDCGIVEPHDNVGCLDLLLDEFCNSKQVARAVACIEGRGDVSGPVDEGVGENDTLVDKSLRDECELKSYLSQFESIETMGVDLRNAWSEFRSERVLQVRDSPKATCCINYCDLCAIECKQTAAQTNADPVALVTKNERCYYEQEIRKKNEEIDKLEAFYIDKLDMLDAMLAEEKQKSSYLRQRVNDLTKKLNKIRECMTFT